MTLPTTRTISPASSEASSATPVAPPRVRLIRSLGAGGMGVVWLAERALGDGLRQRVVLKRPRAEGAGETLTEPALDRFRDEARALARIHHGNVVRLLDAGSDPAGPWMLLEPVDGLDVHALIEALRGAEARLSPHAAAWIVHEAARGVHAAHSLCDAAGEPCPILHRDLSPQNLLVSCQGEVKVTDFGIAWAVDRESRTTTGVVVGNLRYIAPEQLEGRSVSPATDVYGLGRVLEELLAVTACDQGDAHESLARLAARATRRDPDERYATARELLDELVERVPGLARGCDELAARVTGIATRRARVHDAMADLLASGRAEETPVSLTARAATEAPPTVESAPRVSVEAVAARGRTARALVPAALFALGVTGVVWRVSPRDDRPARPRASVVREVIRHAPEAPLAVVAPVAPRDEPATPSPVANVQPVVASSRAALARHARVSHPVAAETTTPTVSPPTAALPTPSQPPATLWLSTIPFAMISIDGSAPRGTPYGVPLTLPAGEHHIVARFTTDGGVVERSRVVELAPGDTQRVGITLQ